jgi:hypothetical protein
LLGSLEQRKQDRDNFFRGDPAVQVFLGQDKLLSAKQTDWDHHPSASLELIDQGSWDQIGRRRNDYLVEGSVLGSAKIAVRDAHFDAGVALSFQPLRQLVDHFDAVDPTGKLGEHGGLATNLSARSHMQEMKAGWLTPRGKAGLP